MGIGRSRPLDVQVRRAVVRVQDDHRGVPALRRPSRHNNHYRATGHSRYRALVLVGVSLQSERSIAESPTGMWCARHSRTCKSGAPAVDWERWCRDTGALARGAGGLAAARGDEGGADKAYIHMIASAAGFDVGTWGQDYDCRDVTLSSSVNYAPYRYGPKIDIQLKCTGQQTDDRNDVIAWSLDSRSYYKLSLKNRSDPALFCVLVAPPVVGHWLHYDQQGLLARSHMCTGAGGMTSRHRSRTRQVRCASAQGQRPDRGQRARADGGGEPMEPGAGTADPLTDDDLLFTGADLAQFLAANNWTCQADRSYDQVWLPPADEGDFVRPVLVPRMPTFVDYRKRLAEATESVARPVPLANQSTGRTDCRHPR